MTTELPDTHSWQPDTVPLALKLNEELGVAVLADGKVVAWFAELDEYAEDYCREHWFGRWLTWRAKRPEIVPLTPEEQARCDAAVRELRAKLRVE